jgi:hypothetical protein
MYTHKKLSVVHLSLNFTRSSWASRCVAVLCCTICIVNSKPANIPVGNWFKDMAFLFCAICVVLLYVKVNLELLRKAGSLNVNEHSHQQCIFLC